MIMKKPKTIERTDQSTRKTTQISWNQFCLEMEFTDPQQMYDRAVQLLDGESLMVPVNQDRPNEKQPCIVYMLIGYGDD